jgi:lipoprotein-releasing system permease protein
MHWIVFLSLKYLPFKGKKQSIQWITRISLFSITVITACAIIIQSVMNGLTHLVVDLYNSLEPDLRVEHQDKKYFRKTEFPFEILKQTSGISFSGVYEKKLLIKNQDKTHFVLAVFCGKDYQNQIPFASIIMEGSAELKGNFLILGKSLADALGTGAEYHSFDLVSILSPPKDKSDVLTGNSEFFNKVDLKVSGIFMLNEELDMSKIYLSEQNLLELVEDTLTLSSVHIKCLGRDVKEIQKKLMVNLGEKWKLKSREESNFALIQTLNTEKKITTYILWFVLLIGLFTVIGSITMIILDKKRDIFILNSMGAELNKIKRIFIMDGLIITLLGGVAGIIIGLAVCFIQQKFHIIPFGDDFIIDYYPVKVEWTDILNTLLAVLMMSLMAGLYPATNFISSNKLQYSRVK